MWMLYDQSYGLYDARNRPIGPNILAGPLRTRMGSARLSIKVPSVGKTGTKTMSESCICQAPNVFSKTYA